MFNIGFTGTQIGMTDAQLSRLSYELCTMRDAFVIHHGDCVGADKQFDTIARTAMMFHHAEIYPCTISSKRAGCGEPFYGDVIYTPRPPLLRNKDICVASDVMYATPKSDREELRSGTWSTIRYRLKLKRTIHIILPSGLIESHYA